MSNQQTIVAYICDTCGETKSSLVPTVRADAIAKSSPGKWSPPILRELAVAPVPKGWVFITRPIGEDDSVRCVACSEKCHLIGPKHPAWEAIDDDDDGWNAGAFRQSLALIKQGDRIILISPRPSDYDLTTRMRATYERAGAVVEVGSRVELDPSEEKVLVYKARPVGGAPWLMSDDLLEIVETIGEQEGQYELHVVRMTRGELAAVGEFEGW